MELTVILADGDFPTHPSLIEAIAGAAHLVCCDGAALALAESGIRDADVVVGDLDSLSPELRAHYAGRLVQESEQETNDLAKAFRLCVARGWTQRLVLLGATGKREDHTLGNIALLFDFAEQVPAIEMWTDYGKFIPVASGKAAQAAPGQQISIFSADSTLPITSRGLVYPLEELRLQRWWNGTLNEAAERSFTLEFPGRTPLLAYLPHPGCGSKHPRRLLSALPWKHIHFCGIGGVGMAGLAQIALDGGCAVSGSDAADSRLFRMLQERGADVHLGHNGANLPPETQLLVYSAAVPEDNPERAEARRRGIPQCRRGEFLARIAPRFRRTAAISGSHGKTTTTAMLAHILREAGCAPGFIVGGLVNGWDASATAGSWDTLITEVDESDRSQEMMLPDVTLILNIDDDHSWAIGGTEALEKCFHTLASRSLRTIALDTPENRRILAGTGDTRFSDFVLPENAVLSVPGEHNRSNAAAAVAAAGMLGVPEAAAIKALETFPGVARRLTRHWRSEDGSRILFDDYAHHPTELKATLETLRKEYPEHELHLYFQPHRPERIIRYGSRFAEIIAAHASRCTIVDTFMAWETDAPEADAASITDAVNRLAPGLAVTSPCNPEKLGGEITSLLLGADSRPLLAVVIGAGDVIGIIKKVDLS